MVLGEAGNSYRNEANSSVRSFQQESFNDSSALIATPPSRTSLKLPPPSLSSSPALSPSSSFLTATPQSTYTKEPVDDSSAISLDGDSSKLGTEDEPLEENNPPGNLYLSNLFKFYFISV